MAEPAGIPIPSGTIAVTTYGVIEAQTAQSLVEMRGHAERIGLTNVQWTFVAGHLVDKARNEAAAQLLRGPGQWIWYLDADMTWQPQLVEQILHTAFVEPATQGADIVGGWCPLRGEPYIPTIDTGTGTWEPHAAGQGPLDVIRTGGACLLVKRHVFERLAYPWFGVRPAPRALDMLTEVDNYARIKFDGRNPFDGDDWQALLRCAREDAASQRAKAAGPDWQFGSVGEDSNFCDQAKAAGFRIVVQTNAVCGHLERRVITPELHNEAMARVAKEHQWLVGINA